MASRNRTAGHNWEREVIKDFVQLGYKDAVSSRYGSKQLDDAGVDVMNTPPYSIQCKNESKKVDYHTLLTNMPGPVPVVMHKFTQKSDGGRFVLKGKYAILKYDDFIALLSRVSK